MMQSLASQHEESLIMPALKPAKHTVTRGVTISKNNNYCIYYFEVAKPCKRHRTGFQQFHMAPAYRATAYLCYRQSVSQCWRVSAGALVIISVGRVILMTAHAKVVGRCPIISAPVDERWYGSLYFCVPSRPSLEESGPIPPCFDIAPTRNHGKSARINHKYFSFTTLLLYTVQSSGTRPGSTPF